MEQDDQFIKKYVRSMLGFKSFGTATAILEGVESMKKEQMYRLVCSKPEMIHPSIVWTNSINNDFCRKPDCSLECILYVYQNLSFY